MASEEKMDINVIAKKMCISVKEASYYSGIGLNFIYELMKRPDCNFVIMVGRRKLIKRELFEQYINDRKELTVE